MQPTRSLLLNQHELNPKISDFLFIMLVRLVGRLDVDVFQCNHITEEHKGICQVPVYTQSKTRYYCGFYFRIRIQ